MQQSLNSGSTKVLSLLMACWIFAMFKTFDNGPSYEIAFRVFCWSIKTFCWSIIQLKLLIIITTQTVFFFFFLVFCFLKGCFNFWKYNGVFILHDSAENKFPIVFWAFRVKKCFWDTWKSIIYIWWVNFFKLGSSYMYLIPQL